MSLGSMNRRCIFMGVLLGVAIVLAPCPSQATNTVVKSALVTIQGPANAAGNFLFKIVARGADCTAGPPDRIWQATVSYDNVPGGIDPTRSDEIRDGIIIALGQVAGGVPAGYSVTAVAGGNANVAQLVIASTDKAATPEFDVCVGFNPGTGVQYIRVVAELPDGDFNRHGVVIHQNYKSKAPGLTAVGMGLLVLLLTSAGGFVLWQRRGAAGIRPV